MRNAAFWATGLAMGAANTVRHNRTGYVTPRPFTSADVPRTIAYAFDVVGNLQDHGEIDWNGKRVLELGPGPDLTTGAVMLARGASRYLAVDMFDNREQAHPDLYRRIGEELGTAVDVDALGFTLATFPTLPEVVGEFDVIVSNATLEHVQDLQEVFRALRRLAAPGARMVHHVDAQTHMRWIRERDPLNILRYPDWMYSRLLDFPGAPNRLRASDYVTLANDASWEARVVPGRLADESYVASFRAAKRFRDYDDLRLLTFTLVCSASD